MKIAYLDCFAGASGDMLLGALVDAGLPEDELVDCIDCLQIEGIKLQINPVHKGAIKATKVNLEYIDHKTERTLGEIHQVVVNSRLPDNIKESAKTIFTEIAEVEAGIHNQKIDEVHLHELGGVDTIVDVTCVLWGFERLEIEQVYASALPLGSGFQKSAHGLIPIPAPATLKLLSGIPVTGREIQAELVTPTGAALIKSLASDFGPIPSMRINSVGYGAGEREFNFPNVLRIIIGQTEKMEGIKTETLFVLETNIDDLNPEIYGHLMDRLFDHNSLDVYLTPIQMKKDRPGTKLSVLCQPEDFEGIAGIIFEETTTTGIRKSLVERYSLPRRTFQVKLPYGEVRIKTVTTPSGDQRFSPEYEDCKRLAKSQGIALLEVYQAAQNAAYEQKP